MKRRPFLKSTLVADTIRFELSLPSLLTGVRSYNRMVRRAHRDNPKETWPLVAVVNPQAFLHHVYRQLPKGNLPGGGNLSINFRYRLHEIIDVAPCRRAGIIRYQPKKPLPPRPKPVKK